MYRLRPRTSTFPSSSACPGASRVGVSTTPLLVGSLRADTSKSIDIRRLSSKRSLLMSSIRMAPATTPCARHRITMAKSIIMRTILFIFIVHRPALWLLSLFPNNYKAYRPVTFLHSAGNGKNHIWCNCNLHPVQVRD